MAGRSSKRKDITPKEGVKDRRNLKTDSDYRLFIVLVGAIILAIAIISAIFLTAPMNP